MTSTITPAQTAAADQAAARLRETRDRIAQTIAIFILGLGAAAGLYGYAAAAGHIPAAPWSPIGIQQQQQQINDGPVVDDSPRQAPVQPQEQAPRTESV